MRVKKFIKHWKLLLIVSAVIISAMLLIFGEHGFLYLENRRIELLEYSRKVDKLAQEKIKLEKEINRLQTDKDYLERVIKSEIDMLKKNEVKYIFKEEENTEVRRQ